MLRWTIFLMNTPCPAFGYFRRRLCVNEGELSPSQYTYLRVQYFSSSPTATRRWASTLLRSFPRRVRYVIRVEQKEDGGFRCRERDRRIDCFNNGQCFHSFVPAIRIHNPFLAVTLGPGVTVWFDPVHGLRRAREMESTRGDERDPFVFDLLGQLDQP